MILLCTDFGPADPYVGQLKAVLARVAPEVAVIDLLHRVPDFNAHAGAHLLAALGQVAAPGDVLLAVVDPGVGGPRAALVIEADGRWLVGPDNGLLSVLAGRARQARAWRIDWRPPGLSATFHGRDLFAPIAAQLARGEFPSDCLSEMAAPEVSFDADDLARVIYLDHYGNAWTGLRGALLAQSDALIVKGQALTYRNHFAEAGRGEVFWTVNSSGLVEIAANRASAADSLGLTVGERIELAASPTSRPH